MATITDLSIEVIYIVLEQKIIDIEDVINFSLTCRRFNDAFDNLLWKTKLYQSFDIRWPYLKKIYDNRIKNNESINFEDEVKANVKCRKALFSYLSLLSEELFNEWKPSESDIKNFDILFRPNIGARIMNYHFLKDELLYQINMSPLDPKCNLMHQYYSKILLPFLQRRHLEDVWLEFINYPKEQQLLEKAATILAQWYQPQKRIYDFDIEASLDDIAQQTLNNLKKAHWDHPIFSTSAEQFSFWKYNNIDYNQWSRIEEKQIIDVLQMVLFDNVISSKTHGIVHGLLLGQFNLKNVPEDIFIDCVSESKIGDTLTLAIIFQSVARRLGVRFDLVYGTSDFWLYWKPKSIAENPEDKEYFCIDIVSSGIIRGRDNYCPMECYNRYREVNPTQMVFFMNAILHNGIFSRDIRLLDMIRSDSINSNETLYYYDKMNMSHFLFSCQASPRIQNDYNNRISLEGSRQTEDILKTFELSVQRMNLQMSRNLIIPKNRTRNMKYAIGMIVTCIKNGSNRTGVIIGWDEKFNSDAKIKYEQLNYKIILSCCQTEQPFYIILSENDVYYAAQDTLIEASPRWIKYSEIGRYFCRFTNIYYVPNEILTRHYPDDQAVILKIHSTSSFHNFSD